MSQRYGCRPSSIMGIDPRLGYSVVFDLRVMEAALEYQQEAETLSGKLRQKQEAWSPAVKRELREQGLWR